MSDMERAKVRALEHIGEELKKQTKTLAEVNANFAIFLRNQESNSEKTPPGENPINPHALEAHDDCDDECLVAQSTFGFDYKDCPKRRPYWERELLNADKNYTLIMKVDEDAALSLRAFGYSVGREYNEYSVYLPYIKKEN